MRTIIIAAALMLSGCASYNNLVNIPTMNVTPPLTPAALQTGIDKCRAKKLIPDPYPIDKPQVVFCKIPSVLPPGYVSPVPYVRVI